MKGNNINKEELKNINIGYAHQYRDTKINQVLFFI